MFWRKIFVILLLTFFVLPLPASAIIDSEKVGACSKLGCLGLDTCSAFQSGGVKDSDGNYYCFSTECENGDDCVFVDRKCNVAEDCTGYSTQEGGQACLNNHCYLDTVGKENFDKGGTVGFTDMKVDLRVKEPKLMIGIPGLVFSKLSSSTVTQENGKTYLNIPYVGEYIAAAYKVGLVVISIIAVVMIIVTGIKIIVSGGEAKVEGFKRIGQIAVGLFIGWGSFTILSIVNPTLVNFQALKVEYFEEIPQTESLTASDLADAAAGEGSPGQFKYFTECPVDLTQPINFADDTISLIPDLKKKPRVNLLPKNIPRRLEFHEKMVTQQILKGTVSQRVAMASEAAAQCQIHYENCGVGTTNIYALASATGGSYGDSARCLQHSKNTKTSVACNSIGNSTKYSPKKVLYDVTGLQTSYGLKVTQLTRGMSCDAKCTKKIWPEACFTNPDLATEKLVSILKDTGKWDPNWINELQPGDYYMIVNWNSYCPGTHSALFLGWKDPAQHIAWVQMGDAGNFIRVGTKKLGKEAIIQISRPVEK